MGAVILVLLIIANIAILRELYLAIDFNLVDTTIGLAIVFFILWLISPT
jgi:hypothetical protein